LAVNVYQLLLSKTEKKVHITVFGNARFLSFTDRLRSEIRTVMFYL